MGDEDGVDDVVRLINEVVGTEDDPQLCWWCLKRIGVPSTCLPCKRYLMGNGPRPDDVSHP